MNLDGGLSARNSGNISRAARHRDRRVGSKTQADLFYRSHTCPLCYIYLYRLSLSPSLSFPLPSLHRLGPRFLNGQRGWARRDDHLPTIVHSTPRCPLRCASRWIMVGWVWVPLLGRVAVGHRKGFCLLPSLTERAGLHTGRRGLACSVYLTSQDYPHTTCGALLFFAPCRLGWVAGMREESRAGS